LSSKINWKKETIATSEVVDKLKVTRGNQIFTQRCTKEEKNYSFFIILYRRTSKEQIGEISSSKDHKEAETFKSSNEY